MLQLFSGVFSSPEQHYEKALAANVRWWGIILVFTLIAAVASYFITVEVMLKENRFEEIVFKKLEPQLEAGNLTMDAVDKIISTQKKAMPYTTPISAAFGAVISFLVIGLALMLTIRTFCQKPISYGQTLQILGIAYPIQIYSSLARSVAIWGTKNLFFTFSPAAFLSVEPEHWLFQLLANFDIFTLWLIVFLGIGIGVWVKRQNTVDPIPVDEVDDSQAALSVSEEIKKRGFVAILSLWGLWIFLKLLMSILF